MKKSFGFLTLFFCATLASSSFAKEKEWALLLFLNANNNLATFGDLNLNQIESIGSTDDVDVIVQWGRTGQDKTYRMKMMKDDDMKKITSPYVETLPRVDMGDYKNLIEFVRWSHEHYPAKRYFIAFWNHGSGWYRGPADPNRGVSYDDYSGNHITTEQMGTAMREIAKIIGHKVDIVGADACLMAMGEVASEMQDSVDVYVASEETEPGVGWPYHMWLNRWVKNSKATPAEVATYLVEEYFESLKEKNGITLSAMDLTRLPAVWERMKELGQHISLLKTSDMTPVHEAIESAISFYSADATDLGHAMTKAKGAKSLVDEKLLMSVQEKVKDLIIANKTSPGYANATGISVWYPKYKSVYERHLNAYQSLRFAKETGWDKVLSTNFSQP